MNYSKCVLTSAAVIVTSTLAIVVGCGSERRAPALVGWSDISDASLRRGQELYAAHCYQCHPNGASGLAPALNDKPAPSALVKTQIRAGMGAMPAFGPDKLADRDVDDLAAYVIALRKVK